MTSNDPTASNARDEASPSTRILLVDDSAVAREKVREILQKTLPAQFTHASDGQEALWKARAEQHDLVITDLHMPTMDGLTLVKELRKLRNYETVPVLILTADPTRERLREGREAGATGWIIKPPKPDALVMTVRHALLYRS